MVYTMNNTEALHKPYINLTEANGLVMAIPLLIDWQQAIKTVAKLFQVDLI